MADYHWTPAGKPRAFLHYHFCKTCGSTTSIAGRSMAFAGELYIVS